MSEDQAAAAKSTSQTLARGIRVLEILAETGQAMTVAAITAELSVDRAVTYRIMRTLAAHRLVVRNRQGEFRLASGVLNLAAGVSRDLQAAAAAELVALARELGATAFVTIDEDGDAVCLAAVEPPRSHVHIAYRPGLRHALRLGASGVALLAGRPPVPGEPAKVTEARRVGYATSRGELQPGAEAIAVPVCPQEGPAVGSVAIVALLGVLDLEQAAPRVREAAVEIAKMLG